LNRTNVTTVNDSDNLTIYRLKYAFNPLAEAFTLKMNLNDIRCDRVMFAVSAAAFND
jgi:hypothetical protein